MSRTGCQLCIELQGGDPSQLKGLDGIDQWDTLTKGKASARVEMLYNIDPLPDMSNGPGGAIR